MAKLDGEIIMNKEDGTYVITVHNGEVVAEKQITKYIDVDRLTIYKLVEVIDNLKDELKLIRDLGILKEIGNE